MSAQLLVLAKAPRPGEVKTRLCPPCSPHQAAAVAEAALQDTFDAVDLIPRQVVGRRCLVLAGGTQPAGATVDSQWWPRTGWELIGQRGDSLGQRISNAFADSAVDGLTSVLIGMDTPQITPELLSRCIRELAVADAVLGHAADGGWWLLGLRDPSRASALASVPTSRPDTGVLTRETLSRAGLTVATAPVLRDVDTASDAWTVAAHCRPESRFVAAVTALVPRPARLRPAGHAGVGVIA
jgi:rSAM/selenodomain-associated transferase 1